MKAPNSSPISRVFYGTALTLLLSGSASFGQRFSVTNILVPSADSFSVAALNAGGQLAGYAYSATAGQRAFFWDQESLDLGTLGGSTSVGNALNSFGQVVGYSSSVGDAEYHAFLGVGRTLFDLGTLGGTVSSATSVSDSGDVTGYSHISASSVDFHAFLTPNNGAMQDLGTLGGSSSSGTAVNNHGQVIGDSSLAGDFENHAFLHDGAMRDLGTLGGSYSSASALNDAGQVTGESTVAGEVATHAFLFDGTLHDLGTLGGTYSSGYVVNEAGLVIGDSSLAGDADYHGFIYRNGAMEDLGTLGGSFSSCWGLNRAGQVVGVSANAAGQHRAFLWMDGVMLDLNDLLPPGSGWELTGAYFINDNGQIVGDGLYQGQAGWYSLTPRPRENQPPVASAGPDQTVPASGPSVLVGLNGSGSSDPDGDDLTFVWSEAGVPFGSTPTLTVSLASGTHHITLSVTDSHGASATDEVVVTVENPRDTVPPTVQCAANRSASANARGQAALPDFLTGLVASDNVTPASALLKAQSPIAGTLLTCGTYSVTLTVSDAASNTTICTVLFTVSDTTPPLVRQLDPISRRAGQNGLALIPDLTLRIRAHDNCTPTNELVIVQQPAPGTQVGLGHHEIHLTVTDNAGNRTSVTVLFDVVDLTPPRFQSLAASPDTLTPANGQMVAVTLSAVVTDNCDPHPQCRIVGVTSSEPVTGPDDKTAPDWNITGNLTVQLRAEVASKTVARLYTIRVACTDAAGNIAYRNETVRVPKGRAK